MKAPLVFWLASSLVALGADGMKFAPIPPTPPEAAVATFETLHGFRMELLAAEPLVTDPVALAYDEDGRAFVAEMNDYPYTDKARHQSGRENPTDAPIGRIRRLVDDDGDGRFDRSTIFAGDLSWPTGIACWKGGIVVTATPDVWYLRDTDGDGRADVREKLIGGFKKLNVQAVMNNPVWGLDQRLYLAGGSNGGEIARPGGKPLVLRRGDVRFDPRDGSLAIVSGGARFGNTRDDWGNRFLCNIRNPAQHIAIESRYLTRHPHLPAVNALVDVAEAGDQLPVHRVSPPEAWRELRARRWSADSTVTAKMPRSELVGTGVVTSSSGVTVYRGDAYPAEFLGNLFVADVAANLFYRIVPEPDGVTFRGHRVDGDREFCAARDLWFRPVNFTNAPDGTLHVCDMYREVIEHPWSLPDDIHAALDLERGRDRGRLYRLAPPDFQARPAPRLSQASTGELVALLAHPNAWHRDTAHRLLFERQDRSAVPALEALLTHPDARARLHALWTLHGLDGLSAETLRTTLRDTDAHLRAAAVLLAEPRLKTEAALRPAVLDLVGDPSPLVRFQAALSIGEAMDADVVPALASIAAQDAADPWMRTAVLSATGAHTAALGLALLKARDSEPRATFLREIGGLVAAAAALESCSTLLDALALAAPTHPKMAEAGAIGLATGLARMGKSVHTFPSAPATRQWLATQASRAIAGLTSSAPAEQLGAIDRLALADFPALAKAAPRVLAPTQSDAVRVAFVRQLQTYREPAVAILLLESWPAQTPAVREASSTALLSRKEWVKTLLEALEQQRVKAAGLSAATRAAILRSTTPELRARAARLFADTGARGEVLARYQPALATPGDATRGRAVFTALCAVCHRKGAEGRDFGPNLGTVGAWSAEQLLTNILDPNREVPPNFTLYTAELKDGRTLAGLIAAETETGLVLKAPDGTGHSLARTEIVSLTATGASAMPEGLEAAIGVEQMADLLAFLRDAP